MSEKCEKKKKKKNRTGRGNLFGGAIYKINTCEHSTRYVCKDPRSVCSRNPALLAPLFFSGNWIKSVTFPKREHVRSPFRWCTPARQLGAHVVFCDGRPGLWAAAVAIAGMVQPGCMTRACPCLHPEPRSRWVTCSLTAIVIGDASGAQRVRCRLAPPRVWRRRRRCRRAAQPIPTAAPP